MLGCVDCEAGYQCFEQLDPGRCFELCATDTPNVTLQTQDDVDNLAALQCEVITGDLTITGPDIESLAGLEHIHVIERSLLVQDTELLEDLSGLEGMLLLVEGLSVDNNAATRSLSALKDTLADEAAIHMNANLVLESLDGLQGFTNPSSIQFTDNHALTDISALSPESTDSLFFSGNQAFTSARFDKLHTIGQHVSGSGRRPGARLRGRRDPHRRQHELACYRPRFAHARRQHDHREQRRARDPRGPTRADEHLDVDGDRAEPELTAVRSR